MFDAEERTIEAYAPRSRRALPRRGPIEARRQTLEARGSRGVDSDSDGNSDSPQPPQAAEHPAVQRRARHQKPQPPHTEAAENVEPGSESARGSSVL